MLTDLRKAGRFLAISCVVAILWDQFAAKLGVPTAHEFVFLFPLNQWFCFAAGIVLFYLSKNEVFKSTVIESRDWAGVYDVLTGVALFVLLRESYMAATLSLFILFCASMSPHTWLGRIARNKWLGQLGVCCYSIYLLHILPLMWFARHSNDVFKIIGFAGATKDFRFLAAFPIFALGCLAAGEVSWHAFEKPCISIGRKVNAML